MCLTTSQSLSTEKKVPPPPTDVDGTPRVTPVAEATIPFPAFDPAFDQPTIDTPHSDDVTFEQFDKAHTVEEGFNPAQLPRL